MRLLAGMLGLALGVLGAACGDDDAGGDAGVVDVDGGRVEMRDGGDEDAGAPGDAGGDAEDGGPVDAGMPDAGPIGSAGCVDGEVLEDGEHTFTVGERERRYILRMPSGYSADRAWPLVFALHGNGGNPGYWDGTSGDRDIRSVLEEEAVLVIAHAIGGNWRDYDAPRESWPARIEEELEYFDTIIEEMKGSLCIDEQAMFSMGFSGGGSFSGVLGCRRTDIRGIAVGGSVIYFDTEECVGTPAAWITIGTEELTDSRAAYRDFFRDRAGCDESTMDTDPDPCVAYDGCGAGTPVHYCQHPGGHVWPGFGSEAMWGFFSSLIE